MLSVESESCVWHSSVIDNTFDRIKILWDPPGSLAWNQTLSDRTELMHQHIEAGMNLTKKLWTMLELWMEGWRHDWQPI